MLGPIRAGHFTFRTSFRVHPIKRIVLIRIKRIVSGTTPNGLPQDWAAQMLCLLVIKRLSTSTFWRQIPSDTRSKQTLVLSGLFGCLENVYKKVLSIRGTMFRPTRSQTPRFGSEEVVVPADRGCVAWGRGVRSR